MKSLLIVAFTLVCIVAGQDINSIVKYSAKTYAFDGLPFLDSPTFRASAFEVVGNVQTKVFTLTLPNTTAVVESSIVVSNNLYQFSGAYGTAYLSKYSLPFTASPVAPVEQIKLANQVQEIPAIFDTKDNIALALVSHLTLIDLSPLSVADSVMAVVGSGKTPGSLVYNTKTKKIYYFQTNYCYAGYCQHIYEYKVNITAGKLTKLEESFTPNYDTSFNSGALTGCSLNANTNVIWCFNSVTKKIFQFPLSNLNNQASFNLPAGTYSEGNIAFNFVTKKAYAIKNGSYSYTVSEIDLTNGAVLRSATFSGSKVVSMTLISDQTLHLGHEFNGIRQMSSINLESFAAQLVNLYV